MERKQWLAVYSKPRWEKKVHRLLTEKGIESYCPLNKISRQWSDRIKIVEEPLFKSYVFVKINDEERTAVRMTNGVVNFVYWQGKPAVIKDKEIKTIKKFLNDYENIEVKQTALHVGSRVTIEQGILMDKSGLVKRVLNNKVEVLIDSLGFRLIAVVDKKKLSPLNGNLPK